MVLVALQAALLAVLVQESRPRRTVVHAANPCGLHAAGLNYPGHTEILAERTGVKEFAMVLAVPGLAVAHVTLHMALHDVFRHLTVGEAKRNRRLGAPQETAGRDEDEDEDDEDGDDDRPSSNAAAEA